MTTKAKAIKPTAAKTAKAIKADAPDERTTPVQADPKSLEAAQSALDKDAAQRKADESGETETIPLELFTVEVSRDNTKTRVKVLEHEVGVLERIHGEENVAEISSETVDVADFDPTVEFDTLIRKYGKNGERAVLEEFPGGPAGVAQATGTSLRREGGEDGKRKKRNKSGEQAMIVDFADVDATPADEMQVRRIIFRKQAGKKSTKR